MKNKINKIKIENFRKFEQLEIDFNDESNYFAIAGSNAVGKTSVLEAINLALSTRSSKFTEVKETDFLSTEPITFEVHFDKPFFLSFDDEGFERLVPCKIYKKRILYRNAKERFKTFSSEYNIETEFFPEEYNRSSEKSRKIKSYEEEFKNKKLLNKQQMIVHSFKQETKTNFTYSIQSSDDEKPHEHNGYKYMTTVLFPVSFYYDNNRERELLSSYNTVFSNIIEELEWRYKKSFVKNDNVKKMGIELKKEIDKTDDYKEKLLLESKNILQENFTLPFSVESLDFYPFNPYKPYQNALWGILSEMEKIIPANLHGAGLANIISLSLSIAFAKKSKEPVIFLIDEPELHLETKLKKQLFSLLKELDSQVIISTHSPHFIDQNICSNTIILEDSEDGISKQYGTKIKVSDLLFRIYAESFDDLVIPERIVLVEGRYDQNILLKCLKLLSKNELKTQFVVAGGKEKIPDKPGQYEKVIEEILKKDRWYSDSIKKILKIVVDADVSQSKIDGWEKKFGIDIKDQVYRVPNQENSSECMEYIFPETLVKELAEKCKTKLTDNTMLKDKTKDEIVNMILEDDEKKEDEKKQSDGYISKQRLNEYVVNHLDVEILKSPEGQALKTLTEWIYQDI